MWKKRWTALLSLMILLMMFNIDAEASSDMDELNELADQALQLVKVKRYEETSVKLDSFSKGLLRMTASSGPFSVDELRVLTSAYNGASESLVNKSGGYEQKVNAVTKLRLVTDAVMSQHEPLWTEMEDRMMTTFKETRKAVNEQNSGAFHEKLNELMTEYDMIYYSLQVDFEADTVESLNSRFDYLDTYRPEIFQDVSSQREIDRLHYDMQQLFDEMKEDEADPSLWWVIISTGSTIIATLSYVGWRKYKGDRKIAKKGRKLND